MRDILFMKNTTFLRKRDVLTYAGDFFKNQNATIKKHEVYIVTQGKNKSCVTFVLEIKVIF